MTSNIDWQNPLAYLGVTSRNPPDLIKSTRAPTANDRRFAIGTIWVNTVGNISYELMSISAGVATWGVLSPGSSDVDTVNGLGPVAGDILIAGGTNLTDVNAGHTVTLNLDPAITLATSVTSPLYTAGAGVDVAITAPAGEDIIITMGDAAGANKVSFVDTAAAEVFSIDSNGVLGTVAGLTVVGALTQTAGIVNIGQDNAANAINLGGGTAARAMTIASGAAAHTLAIGSAAAGTMSIDTAAGISLDGATGSNFTVTGATQDLTLASVGGSVGLSASESVADAIVINASGAAGAVQIKAGTGGVLIGDEADTTTIDVGNFAPTANRTITVGGGTVITAATTDTISVGAGGATTNANSVKTVNVNTGGVTLGQVLTNIASGNVTSGTHTTSIATGNRAAGTMVMDVMTGTGTKTFNLGNADGLTTYNIDATTLIADSVNTNTSINTGTSTGTVTIGNGLSGAIGVVGGAAVTVDAVGVLELNSSAAAISVGNDANNFAVNVGTAGTRTVTVGSATAGSSTVIQSGTGAANFASNATDHTTTVGSTTGVSATVLQAGTGKFTVTGTVRDLTADYMTRVGDSITFYSNPTCTTALSTGGVPTGATGDVNMVHCREGVIMEEFVIGAGQTIIAPRMDANGLLVSGDLTLAEGYEYNFGAARTNSRNAFTIGTSPAFQFQLRYRINDMDGADPYIFGFRKVEANNATWTNYTDYATIGMIASTSATAVVTATELNAGGTTITNTTTLWGGDGTTNTLTVLVSSAGVVTYLINGVAPAVVAAFTFDNGDVVVPFIRITHSATPTQVDLVSMRVGFQV